MGEGADAVAAAVKGLVIAAGLIGLSFGIVGAVVFGFDDEGTFVPPPEIVAEEFVRALGQGRIEPARSMLSSEAEHATSIEEVRLISTRFRLRVGHLDDVQGTLADRTRDTAIVRAYVEGQRANAELVLPLVREYGVWSVARLSELLTPADASPARGATSR